MKRGNHRQSTKSRQGDGSALAKTRDKIVGAALAEFSAKGLAGARVDEIARRARVNKRMLYYCFGNKDGLYREVLRRKIAERSSFIDAIPDNLGDALLHIYRSGGADIEFVRLMEWEAIDRGKGRLIAEQERRALFERTLERLRLLQRTGGLPRELNLTQLFISIIALAIFPLTMPQMIRLITGMEPTAARFRRERLEFLRWLGERVTGGAGASGNSRRQIGKPTSTQKSQRRSRSTVASIAR